MMNTSGSDNAGFETKRYGDDDIGSAFDDFMRAFEAFKETNDQRLDDIEKRMIGEHSHKGNMTCDVRVVLTLPDIQMTC